jgi:hypothetical protein
VVGDLVGHGAAQEQAVVGDTPNLAARLQALAEPGSVVVAEATRRLLGGAFELKTLGPQTLKGFDQPVPAWTVIREAENISRFEASRSHGLTPFVGREHEVALLLDRWRDATEGEGQAALVSGEAGIGKSRILAALREKIADAPHVIVRYQCSPHRVNDAFYPIASQICHAAGFVSGEPSAARLDKLEAMISGSGLGAKEIAPLLASLLSIPGEGRYPPLEMAPSEQKERTIAALIALFAGLTRDTPVLALLEDAHWVDPTSLDVFGRLVDGLPGLRALLIITFRPEFAAPWVGRAHVATLSLSRFGRRQAVAMIERVTGGKALPAEVLEQIVAKTDGVPLFMEELTKTVLESGLLREEGGSYVLASALTPLAIPSTLQDSLMARLDRFAPIRETAQIAAAIGREFSYRLLEAVSPIQGAALQDALGQLMGAELIHVRGTPPEATYVFKHALVQDTAYASLLRSRRQRIHADIARALEVRFADQVEAAPAIVAHHFTEAGIHEPATRYWLKAAELALSRSALAESAGYTDAGLAIVSRMIEGSERQILELALLTARANSLLPSLGETVEALTAAKRHLDAGIGNDLQRFSVLHGLCAASYFAGKMISALAIAQETVVLAEQQTEPTYLVIGYRLLGTMQVLTGNPRDGLVSLRSAERYRDPITQRSLSSWFGIDPGLNVLNWKIMALMLLGCHEQAIQFSEHMQVELASHGNPHTIAAGTFYAVVWPDFLFGDLEGSERSSAALIKYCAEKRVEQLRRVSTLCKSCAVARREPTDENIAAVRTAIEVNRRSGAHILESVFNSQLAEALLAAGDLGNSQATLQEGVAFVEQSGERFWLSEFHRIGGQIALRQRGVDTALVEAQFQEAIEIARKQEARLLELRAATDLARLWHNTGSQNNPFALLEPIIAAIEGGESTRDVRSARALLAEMV